MNGTNASTGGPLSGVAHLRQSIADILGTPIGSRVMRRDYGSRLFQLVDAPTNAATLLQISAATAEALDRWEPRFRLTSVSVAASAQGTLTLDLTGEYLPDGEAVTLEGVIVR